MDAAHTTDALDDLRGRIDAIDDELIRLLKQRIDVVDQVGRHKLRNGELGLLVRSGREGAMLRRVFDAFADSAFNAQAAAAMWRLMISASIHHESPLSLSVYSTPQEPHLFWLAREYFGGFVPISSAGHSGQILGELGSGRATVGVVPYPDDTANWWASITHEQGVTVRIFAHIPAVIGNLPQSVPYGLALGYLIPEASGEDQSYFRLTVKDTVSTSKLQTYFQQAGLDVTIMQAITHPPMRSLLLRIDGFYTHESDAIRRLGETIKDSDWCWLGAHPKPITA